MTKAPVPPLVNWIVPNLALRDYSPHLPQAGNVVKGHGCGARQAKPSCRLDPE